jgi:hypothetical protein
MSVRYKISQSSNSKFLQPDGGGTINVVDDMAWTMSPKSSRVDVPYIDLTEYQQTTGQLIASIIYYGRVINNITKKGFESTTAYDDQVYNFKFFAEPTGFVYRLPYFNPKKTARGNQFGSEDNPFSGILELGGMMAAASVVGQKASNMLGKLGKGNAISHAALGIGNMAIPGKIGFEFPKSWDNTDIETIEVTFDLFNTGKFTDVEDNRNLCHILNYQNTPSRRNFSIVDPPVIYSLRIPDVAYFPACHMSNLGITNLGNTRIMQIGSQNRTVPEAYRISMTFTSLLMPTRNILSSLDSGSTVQAISREAITPENFIKATDILTKNLNNNLKQIGNPPDTNYSGEGGSF